MVKLGMIWFFFFGPLFTLSLLMVGIVLPRGFSYRDIKRGTRFLLLITVVTLLGVLLPVFTSPHYSALLTCIFYAFLIASMQRIRRWRFRGQPTGLAIVRSVPTVAIALLPLVVFAKPLHISNNTAPWTWCSPWTALTERSRVQSQMERIPGRHLLLVHYRPDHDYMQGWVYNGADIDDSRIVWANDMGWEKNQELIEYFKDRDVWIVDPDQFPASISRCPSPGSRCQGNDY